MLSQSTCRKLTLWLAAMLLLHAVLASRSWRAIGTGLPDFSSFYTAGKILHDRHGYELYDDRVQETVQRSFFPIGMQERGSILPFIHPPFEAVLFIPFARIPYLGAYLVWLGINLGLTFAVVVLLRRNFVALGSAPFYLWMLAGFGFYPLFIALLQGQDSILLLFCYTMAFLAFRRGSQSREGAWVGLGLCKPHLVVPFIFPLIVLRRTKFLTGFFSVALVLAVLGLVAVGWKGSLSYPAYVIASENNPSYFWTSVVGHTANIRGIVESLCTAENSQLRIGLTLIACLMLLGALTYAAGIALRMTAVYPDLIVALSLIATVLVGYHILVHDMSILFLAVLIVLEVFLSSQMFHTWSRRILLTCIGILFCSPVYMWLTLRYKHSEFIGAVLLVFFVVLLVEFVRIQPRPSVRPTPALANPEFH